VKPTVKPAPLVPVRGTDMARIVWTWSAGVNREWTQSPYRRVLMPAFADSGSVTNNDVNAGPVNGQPDPTDAGTWTDSCTTGYEYNGTSVVVTSGPTCSESHSGGKQGYIFSFHVEWTGCTTNGTASVNCGNNLCVQTLSPTLQVLGTAIYYNRTLITETGSYSYNNSVNWNASGPC